jgi:hypothetical protein
MSMTHPSVCRCPAERQELRVLVDDLVYARVLVELDRGALGEHDRLLRVALREALEKLAATEAERRRIAEQALETAWARVAAEVRRAPNRARRGRVASAA